jgi:hypothetical protein
MAPQYSVKFDLAAVSTMIYIPTVWTPRLSSSSPAPLDYVWDTMSSTADGLDNTYSLFYPARVITTNAVFIFAERIEEDCL